MLHARSTTVPESDKPTADLRRNEEQNQMAKCIREVVGCAIELKSVTRLGRKNENHLAVQISNLNEKRKLLSKAKKFNDPNNKVSKNLTFKSDQ